MQKTAYEMLISDWSSDVCSSDLVQNGERQRQIAQRLGLHPGRDEEIAAAGIGQALPDPGGAAAIAVGLDRRAARRTPAHRIAHAPVGGERRGIETEARSEEPRVGKECVSTV